MADFERCPIGTKEFVAAAVRLLRSFERASIAEAERHERLAAKDAGELQIARRDKSDVDRLIARLVAGVAEAGEALLRDF